jgi:hypothetical protein
MVDSTAHEQQIPSGYVIDASYFNNQAALDARAAALPAATDRTFFRKTLGFLYLAEVKNSPMEADRPLKADRRALLSQHLSPAEWQIFKNLTKFAHSSRKRYGHAAVQAARADRYRCRRCKMPDVRTLEMDHVNGRGDTQNFQLLCSNCHKIKSREVDWTGHLPATDSPLI